MQGTSHRMWRTIACGCTCLLIAFQSLLAQETAGSIAGIVNDTTGTPIVNILVTARSPHLQGERATSTNAQGEFRFLALPIGEYTVSISHISYEPIALRAVRVHLGATTNVGVIQLRDATIRMPEVVVTSSQPAIDLSSMLLGSRLSPDEFRLLPIQRSYDRIIALLPQANESYLGDGINVAGATGMENKYFVDGVDVSDPYRGIAGTSLPYNIIRELQVKNGAYEAEYRSTLGGVVNVITYSGGNELTGRVFGYYTNNDMSGTPRGGALAPPKGGFAQYDVGFGLGGPIIRDRLWFFVAYSPVFLSEKVDVPGLGFYTDRSTSHIVSGNMTLRISEAHSVMVALSGDPTDRDAVGQAFGEFGTPGRFLNPDPYLGSVTQGGIGIRAKGSHILSDRLLIESSLSWMRRNDRFMPSTAIGESEPLFVDIPTATWSGGYPMRVDNRSTMIGASLRGTLQMEKHVGKAGIEYRESALDAFIKLSVIQRFSPFFYQRIAYNTDGRIVNRGISGFVQDAWEASRRLSFNAGLRWDGQFIYGSDGQLAQSILGQWQPRIGVILRPGNDNADKITVTYGRFYQDLLTYASTLYHIKGATQQVFAHTQDPRTDLMGGMPLVNSVSSIQPEVDDLRGQGFDEVTLGYERMLSETFVGGLRGVYRTLTDAIEDAEDPVGSKRFSLGNPGRGTLSAYPAPVRIYAGLEFTLRRTMDANPWFLFSYVLSRSEGNYPGLFNSDFEVRLPNASKSFDYPENMVNASGLLPNDLPHVLKLSASYKFDFGVTCGLFVLWQSGTPLSEFGGSRAGGFNYNFLRPRGTVGRTSSIFDANVRLTYDLPEGSLGTLRVRLVADVTHIASDRTPVDYEQIRFFNVDANGNQINPNPLYGQPTKFLPPMSLRVGAEVMF